MPVVGEEHRALHPGGRHDRRSDLEPVLRLPRLLHPRDRLRPRRTPPRAGAPARHLRAPRSGRCTWTRPPIGGRYDEMLKREGVPFWPDAAWRDVVFGAAVVATIVLLALIVGPPELGKPPDPSILEAYPQARLVLPLVLRAAGARAAQPRELHHRGRAARLRRGAAPAPAVQPRRAQCTRAPAVGPAGGLHVDGDRRLLGRRKPGRLVTRLHRGALACVRRPEHRPRGPRRRAALP